jgi:hypothetical protein
MTPEEYIKLRLEEDSFEDVLEEFDMDPVEVFIILHNMGYIDETLF